MAEEGHVLGEEPIPGRDLDGTEFWRIRLREELGSRILANPAT